MEQTRFERSENRVCVTSLWKGTFGKICVQTANKFAVCFEWNERNEVRAKREPSPCKTESGQSSRDLFLPFFACLRCNEDKIWAMHYYTAFHPFSCVYTAMKSKIGQSFSKEVLLQPVLWLFDVSLLQRKQNLVNAQKKHYLDPFLPFFACLHCNEDKIWSMHWRCITRPFPSFLRVSSLQRRQNLVNAL